MNIPIIGSFGLANNAGGQAATSSGSDGNGVVQSFLDYMKESPAQRMIDAWLKAHGLSEQALQNMSPVQREAIEKEMAQDIANQVKQKTDSQLSALG